MTHFRLAQLQKTVLLLFVTIFVLFLYTLLHEGGHALVGWWSGGTVTTFNVNFFNLTAHVGLRGDFTPTQTIINNLAGTALPLLVWLVLMGLVPRRANLALEALKVISALVCLNTLMTWMVLPVLFQFGYAPTDDVINFLNNSGVQPWWVTAGALLLYSSGWWLFLTKVEGVRQLRGRLSTAAAPLLQPGVRPTLLALVGIFVLGGSIAFSANGYRWTAPATAPTQPPAGYAFVKTVDLAQVSAAQSTVYTFKLDHPQVIGLYVLLTDVRADYLDLQLTGEAGYNNNLLHAEGYTAQQGDAQVEANLPAGVYHCRLTSRSATGVLALYTRTTS